MTYAGGVKCRACVRPLGDKLCEEVSWMEPLLSGPDPGHILMCPMADTDNSDVEPPGSAGPSLRVRVRVCV